MPESQTNTSAITRIACWAIKMFFVGFFVFSGLAAASYFYLDIFENGFKKQSNINKTDVHFSDELFIEDVRENKKQTSTDFFAAIHNKGSTTWESISIQIELLDEDKNLIDECTTYMGMAIKPGDKEQFKLNCGYGSGAGCSTDPQKAYALVYDSFDIKIESALTSR